MIINLYNKILISGVLYSPHFYDYVQRKIILFKILDKIPRGISFYGIKFHKNYILWFIVYVYSLVDHCDMLSVCNQFNSIIYA